MNRYVQYITYHASKNKNEKTYTIEPTITYRTISLKSGLRSTSKPVSD